MAIHLKGVVVSCLLLLILMEEAKPVVAKKQKLAKVVKKLKERVEKVEERLKALEECQPCAKIKELTAAVNELKEEGNSKPAPAAAGLEDSAILKEDASYLEALGDFLKPVVQSNSHWKRCWQASKDGWGASTFHSLCDGKGPTVTIVRVKNEYIFGGYTSLSWKQISNCGFQYDSEAFLFSLDNTPRWPPVKLDQTGRFGSDHTYSIYTCSTHGPSFGSYDVYIADHASSNTLSYSTLGNTYGPPSGHSYESPFANSFLAGSQFFQPDEVEVFFETT